MSDADCFLHGMQENTKYEGNHGNGNNDINDIPMEKRTGKTLYVSDLDGTLLDNSSRLSPATEHMLNELIAGEALFTIATARTPATAVGLMENVNTKLPFVVMAGCALWDNAAKDYLSARILKPEYVCTLLSIFRKHGNSPFVYHRDGNRIMVQHSEVMNNDEEAFISPRLNTPYKYLRLVDSTTDEISPHNVMLIFGTGRFDRLRAMADDIDNSGVPCQYNCYHDISSPGAGIIDIYAENTTKALAIDEVARMCGAGRVVTFGDNLNDIPMMETANWSVAVDNAFPEVKLAASETIGANTEDAVAKWIWRDFFGRQYREV